MPKPKKEQKKRRAHPLLGLAASAPFAGIFYFCKYVLPGYSFTALVCLCIIGVILFYTLIPFLGQYFPTAQKVLTRIVTVCLILGLTVCAITEGFIIRASFGDPDDHADYMVVLGAKVRPDGPSVSLWDRIYKAYDYLTEHPDVIAVVSGGQGDDEVMSEARSMYDNLTAMGIDPDRVWMEDQATSTWISSRRKPASGPRSWQSSPANTTCSAPALWRRNWASTLWASRPAPPGSPSSSTTACARWQACGTLFC